MTKRKEMKEENEKEKEINRKGVLKEKRRRKVKEKIEEVICKTYQIIAGQTSFLSQCTTSIKPFSLRPIPFIDIV